MNDLNPECAIHFTQLDDKDSEILRRVDAIERTVNGNHKPGLKQDVAELKRDVEDVCNSNNRIESTLEGFVATYKADRDKGSEGDKNRKVEIGKVLLNNVGLIVSAVVNALMLLWLFNNGVQ